MIDQSGLMSLTGKMTSSGMREYSKAREGVETTRMIGMVEMMELMALILLIKSIQFQHLKEPSCTAIDALLETLHRLASGNFCDHALTTITSH